MVIYGILVLHETVWRMALLHRVLIYALMIPHLKMMLVFYCGVAAYRLTVFRPATVKNDQMVFLMICQTVYLMI
jgi:hypothetical protein